VVIKITQAYFNQLYRILLPMFRITVTYNLLIDFAAMTKQHENYG